jgi:hypothetical protein
MSAQSPGHAGGHRSKVLTVIGSLVLWVFGKWCRKISYLTEKNFRTVFALVTNYTMLFGYAQAKKTELVQ